MDNSKISILAVFDAWCIGIRVHHLLVYVTTTSWTTLSVRGIGLPFACTAQNGLLFVRFGTLCVLGIWVAMGTLVHVTVYSSAVVVPLKGSLSGIIQI